MWSAGAAPKRRFEKEVQQSAGFGMFGEQPACARTAVQSVTRRNPGGDAHRDYLGSGVGVVGVRFDATFMVCE
ncbi:hypothetical protein [Nocardia sp. NPDC058114]|uniref:hypothetical protein n=1 Tax=Nocardia sp. NPDC058114 TaxID=3346346 RepID=UPI0036DF2E5E